MTWVKENAKAAIAFFTALGVWGSTAMADGQIDGVEWFGLTGVMVSALGVWATTNAPTEVQLLELQAAIDSNN